VSQRAHNIAGQAVKTLANGPATAGFHTCRRDGRDAGCQRDSAGLYFYKLDAAGASEVRRLVVVR